MNYLRNSRKPLNPARVMVFGFMGVIFTGSLLLTLPPMYEGEGIAYLDALFTATSAVCVTGLVVVDTGSFYTLPGQVIIMVLIFIGSLGFMTMTTLIFIFLGRRISLRDRIIVKEALNQESLAGLVPLVKTVAQMALFFIMIGAVLLSVKFIPVYGYGQGFFFAFFHAISAFGNAGFDLFGGYDSLTLFPADYLVNGTIMVLFIFGGLGFTVIHELSNRLRFRHRLSLHSHLVLVITAFLLVLGTAFVFILEYNNPLTIGNINGGAKIFTALFTSATARTAGFNVLETGAMSYSTLVILMALMFIGASPTSTGGGVKTTTFGVVLITFIAMISGRKEPVIFMRRFPLYQIMRAVSIMSAAVGLIFLTTFALTLFEDHDFLSLLFEAFSAFGTVGLSTGITPELSGPGKAALIVTMFCGRIGPLTLLVALTLKKPEAESLQYPEENLMIG